MGPRSRGASAHSSPRRIASVRRTRSARALALSSAVSLPPGPDPVARPPEDDPVMDWYLPRSATLRLGVGRPLPACAGGLALAGASWLCAGSSAVPLGGPVLLRRNTRIA